MVCAGCGTELPPDELLPFRCPQAASGDGGGDGDDIDHVLRPVMPRPERFPHDRDPQPFARYRTLSLSYDFARAHGLSDDDYVHVVRELDRAVAAVDGHNFVQTPFEHHGALSHDLGFVPGAGIWIKDETGNVAGSHKARHLMGIALWLRVTQGGARVRLAVASCGNAALAAAVVARAAGHDPEVFVPPDAEPSVVRRLRDLGAAITTCERQAGVAGDPCVRAFHAAVQDGALPFGCQGSENGLTIEGGQTLGFEMVDSLADQEMTLDALFVQVGGGALASAVIQALARAHALGNLAKLPRLHAVQTEGAAPLARAYDLVATRLAERLGITATHPAQRAQQILERDAGGAIDQELRYAATHRSSFMWPWEEEPHSFARGILDDETYDWHAVVAGMVRSGGYPVIAGEQTLRDAHELAHGLTAIPVCPTGAAGLAGLLTLKDRGDWHADERVAVLFTGVQR